MEKTLTFMASPELIKKIKLHALLNGMSVKAYIVGLIEKDLDEVEKKENE